MSLGVAGAPLALIGLMLFENAYVQAGQTVPLLDAQLKSSRKIRVNPVAKN